MKRNTLEWIVVALLAASLTRCGDKTEVSSNNLVTDSFIQSYTNHKYDFLFIIDNSESIIPSIEFIQDHLQSFMNNLNSRKAVDFQIAVATTDYFTEVGRLRTNSIGQKVAKSSEPNPLGIVDTILDKLIMDINTNASTTSFWERPFDTLKTAMETYGGEFSRNGVDTVAFILSDENDFSCGPNPRSSPKCSNVAPGTNPIPPGGTITYERPDDSYFTSVLSQIKKQQNAALHIVPIVGLNDSDCEVASVATDTLRIANAINSSQLGAISAPGSICEDKIAQSFLELASHLADRGLSFKLSHVPRDLDFVVMVNGVKKPVGLEWTYESSSNSIVFHNNPPKNGANISVSYTKK